MVDVILVGLGFVVSLFGLTQCYSGWKKFKQHRLVTGTPTTEIQNIDSEGQVELRGAIVRPTTGNGFASPFNQTGDTVIAGWRIEEYNEHGEDNFQTIASGVKSTPFHLNDGTGQIQVALKDRDDVVCEWKDISMVEEIGVDHAPPAHITQFETEHDISEQQSGMFTDIADHGNAHGDRHYFERLLSSGDVIYLLGQVRAAEDTTTVSHSDDAIITPVDDETFIISDLPEDRLTSRLSTDYRFSLGGGTVAVVLGVGLVVAGTIRSRLIPS
jgi:hypothetical protein